MVDADVVIDSSNVVQLINDHDVDIIGSNTEVGLADVNRNEYWKDYRSVARKSKELNNSLEQITHHLTLTNKKK